MSHLSTQEIIGHLADLTGALTSETDHVRLLDRIILGCMSLTNADGGTLYTLDENSDNDLNIAILHNRSLGIHGKPSNFPTIEIYNSRQQASKLVAVQTFVSKQTINIPDAYSCTDYDFSGTRNFDKQLSYHSKSFLCVPLNDHENVTIGVLQLINALDEDDNIIEFDQTHLELVQSLASLAATVLTKRRLIDAQRELFESFIKLIGRAIDHKSPVTGKHCEQVPEIAMLMADAINNAAQGAFANTEFNEQELYELRIAAWLHDCGKITTPEYIIDKATKLHTMFDRIELISNRFKIYRQHLQLNFLQQMSEWSAQETALQQQALDQQFKQLNDDLAFLRTTNTGKEFTSEEDQQRINAIGELRWEDEDGIHCLLTKDEIKNLCISRGTLTEDERQIMRDHIKVSIDMLESLKYPRQLAEVPEIACNHHEHMNGGGYPRGLTGDQLSLRARIMCIADVFEALTSPDRPYKKGMLLSKAMNILGRMVEDGHLDPQLFRLFVESGTYRTYAERHMSPRQIDTFDDTTLPGLNS
ncbi:HD domain-containing phosphohydrolase [Aliamphritea spongicola]|uniref:HD domain-containing phosphohydrolase n=1 Tax=Aliamphritea spongicola TaxID=707589 RepID=UPI00196A56A2|nr:HD domain-containing phosphohydrolase [Aliamphritea spongicola]MBN3560965.1 HD domain-containing protein [Aliamphritea spongicola]